MNAETHGFRLKVKPRGALFFGGYSASTGASGGDTAHDRHSVLIPASAVKGALRESALRLVNGSGQDPQPLISMFGDEYSEREGKLRFAPLRPRDPDEDPFGIRHHVSLSRETRSAAAGHLFEQRVVAAGRTLELEGALDLLAPLEAEELELLHAAVDLTDQLGAGRGRGLGQVELSLEPTGVPEPKGTGTHDGLTVEMPPVEMSSGRVRLVLELEVLEPLKLGQVKERSNVASPVEVIAGSMTRGAVAAAVQRLPGLDSHEKDAVLKDLMVGQGAVVFGDGHPVPSAELSTPSDDATDVVLAPRTLQVPKAGGRPKDTAVQLCLTALGRARPAPPESGMTTAAGSWAASPKDTDSEWKRVAVPRRLITRLARDSISGRAADGKLYSLDVVDPGAATHPGPLLYHVPVEGTEAQLNQVLRAVQAGIWVGGTRSRGFGGVRLRRVLRIPASPVDERHKVWAQALESSGLELEVARSTGSVLALGPVALPQPRLAARLAELGLILIGGSSRRRLLGGWNTRAGLPRTAQGCFLPGSVWIVRTQDGGSALPALEELERQGLGPGRPDGWGRLVVCHRIHTDCLALTP